MARFNVRAVNSLIFTVEAAEIIDSSDKYDYYFLFKTKKGHWKGHFYMNRNNVASVEKYTNFMGVNCVDITLKIDA